MQIVDFVRPRISGCECEMVAAGDEGASGTFEKAGEAAGPTHPLEPVVQKVGARLIWFLVLLCFFSVLDQVNVGLAALSMNKAIA